MVECLASLQEHWDINGTLWYTPAILTCRQQKQMDEISVILSPMQVHGQPGLHDGPSQNKQSTTNKQQQKTPNPQNNPIADQILPRHLANSKWPQRGQQHGAHLLLGTLSFQISIFFFFFLFFCFFSKPYLENKQTKVGNNYNQQWGQKKYSSICKHQKLRKLIHEDYQENHHEAQ